MKRHEALEQLSRDHHQALFQAMRLKRAGEDDAGTVLADFLDFWFGVGHLHFRAEEEVLLPAYSAYADASRDEVVRYLNTLFDSMILAYPSRRYRSALIGIIVHSSQSVIAGALILTLVLS